MDPHLKLTSMSYANVDIDYSKVAERCDVEIISVKQTVLNWGVIAMTLS